MRYDLCGVHVAQSCGVIYVPSQSGVIYVVQLRGISERVRLCGVGYVVQAIYRQNVHSGRTVRTQDPWRPKFGLFWQGKRQRTGRRDKDANVP